jgi:hypothetical protein
MKRLLLAAFLSCFAVPGFSQEGTNTIFGLYGGAGMATSNNYNVAPSVGFSFIKGIHTRGFLGADLFYQTFSLYYDNEAHGATHGAGTAGAIVRNASSYVFITPKLEYGFGRYQHVHIYGSVGAGFKVGGYDSLRKFDHSYSSTGNPNNYDSSLDQSKNMNSLLLRFSVGVKEYFSLGAHWRFTLTEDFGFIGSSLTKDDLTNPSRTPYTPRSLSPGYISLQIGIAHTKYR